jgi:N-acetylneuraminic acid mutarotase
MAFLVAIIIGATIKGISENQFAEAVEAQAIASQETSLGNYWTAEASMAVARSGLGAAVVDGKIYAIGGRNGDRILGINQQYDPTTNTWINKAAMPTPRYDFAVAVYGGKIYCIGGIATLNYHWGEFNYSLSTVNEVYDPATDTWSTEAAMPQGSDGEASIVNGEIFVINARADPNIALTQAYNPVTNQWKMKTPMPERNGFCAASAVIGDKIYVFGGNDYSLTYLIVQIYDTTTDAWTTGTSPPVYMGNSIKGAVTIGSPGSQKIDLFGLTGHASTVSNGTNANQIYDPSTDSWMVMASMPTSRQNFGLALLGNDVYVIGGSIAYLPFPGDTGSSTWYFSTNERYATPAVVTLSTPTITTPPATNTTLSPQSEPKQGIISEEIAVGTVAVILLIVVSVIALKLDRKERKKK